MTATAQIETLISPSLEAMGYHVVRVSYGGGARPTLQVMVERVDEAGMTVDDCATISHTVSALLDVADPIPNEYTLEVSSPGIDRPLVRIADYERYAGFDARVETGRPVEGRKRFKGRLLGIEGEDIRLLVEEAGEVRVPFAEIARGKLILTDALIAASQRPLPDADLSTPTS